MGFVRSGFLAFIQIRSRNFAINFESAKQPLLQRHKLFALQSDLQQKAEGRHLPHEHAPSHIRCVIFLIHKDPSRQGCTARRTHEHRRHYMLAIASTISTVSSITIIPPEPDIRPADAMGHQNQGVCHLFPSRIQFHP